MDKEFQTSFIPKKPIVEEPAYRVKKPTSLVVLLSTIIFIATLLSAGGVYLYKNYVSSNVMTMQSSLEKAKGYFEPSLISSIQELEKRINASNLVLNNHISVYPIFEALQATTLKTTQFNKFSYTFDKDKKIVEVIMSGVTRGYTLIALQAEALGKNKNLKNIIFSNLVLDNKGNVSFDLTFSVDQTFVLYSENLNKEEENINQNNT